jgi:hypothetical protein
MAVAIHSRRPVRGETAVAERPDGLRIRFQPFPTPVMGENGELIAAVNMLVDISEDCGPAYYSPSERVRQALQTFTISEVQDLVEEIETALDDCRPPRVLN